MLKQFDKATFLANYWQKAPMLVKGAFRQPPNYISADELAGLSLEEDVESRIILHDHDEWQLLHGPFDESYFAELPESDWTLLVQTVDCWVPQINQLLGKFNFIPKWRFDDVMVSYASNKGGVGPHFDNYDVFLIQGEGERRWRVGNQGDTGARRTRINGLLHLESFTPVIDVILQPGDMLYIPPDTPHWGESIGESIGYSVGYRAPQTRDLMALLAEHFDESCDNEFFVDSYRKQVNDDNQLEPELINWAQNELIKISNNQSLIASLLSKSLSNSKISPPHSVATDIHCDKLISGNIRLLPGVNCNWYKIDEHITFSIEGDSFEFEGQVATLVKTLASGKALEIKEYPPNSAEFAFFQTLARIIDRGYFLYSQ